MDKGEYQPNGMVQGDNHPMPNKGTTEGVTDTYGADLSPTATNREGAIRHATKSDDEGKFA